MHATWTVGQEMIDAYRNSLKAWKKLDMQREIDRKKYFEGFKYGREKTMFKEELDDLEKAYAIRINLQDKSIAEMLPSLLYYMEEFVNRHKELEEFQDKLDILRDKMSKNHEEKKDE